jgi:hypothetical protein
MDMLVRYSGLGSEWSATRKLCRDSVAGSNRKQSVVALGRITRLPEM